MRNQIIVFIILSFLIVGGHSTPLHAQNDTLTQVADAYRNQVNWTTYHANASTRLQMAFSLEAGEIRFEQADTTIVNIDATYDTVNDSIEGRLDTTLTQRISAGGRDANVLNAFADINLVSMGDTIYVLGEIGDTETDYSVDEWTVLDTDEVALDIDKLTDYANFRDVEALADIIEETGVVVDSDTVNIRQYENDLTYYLIQIDVQAGLEVLNIDFEALLAPALENEFVEETVFWERVFENSELILGVFLDSESGALVAENIVLAVNVEMNETDITATGEEILLVVDYSYEWSNLYTAVNEPVEIVTPVD